MSALERRYRRLLALLPWEHRRSYEDEMLGVLLDGAAVGQRWPRPAEVVDIARAAAWQHARRAATDLRSPQWTTAAATVGALAAIVMATVSVRRMAMDVAATLAFQSELMVPGTSDLIRAALWAAAAAAALVGWRDRAAALATLGAAVEVYLFVAVLDVHLAFGWPAIVPSLLAAATLAAAARGGARPSLGWRRLAVAGVACGVVVAASVVDLFVHADRNPVYLLGRPLEVTGLALGGLAVAALAAVLWSLPPRVRRRALVLTLAPLAVPVVMRGGVVSAYYAPDVQVLGPIEEVLLLAVPVLAFTLGVVLVRRREQRLRLLDLGRAADRDSS